MTREIVHGTTTAYRTRGCRCVLCRRAESRRVLDWQVRAAKHGGSTTVPSVGMLRRLQALAAIGWPVKHVAEHARLSPSALQTFLYVPTVRTSRERAEAIAKVYEELCMTPGPSKSAATAARKRGWAPPLAWDDIDHDEAPQGVARVSPDSEHRLDDIAELLDLGETPDEIAARYDVTPAALVSAAYRAGRHDLGRRLNRKKVAA